MNQTPAHIDRLALERRIENAEHNAYHGCGQSDHLYESRAQAAYARILAATPEPDRAETEAVLRSRGFDPDFVPDPVGPGECNLTGILTYNCPCGRHE